MEADQELVTLEDLRIRLQEAGAAGQFEQVTCKDWISRMSEAGEMVLVALAERGGVISPFVFSALLEGGDAEREHFLDETVWEFDQSLGQPGIISSPGNTEEPWTYDDGQREQCVRSELWLRPFVLSRYFDGPQDPRFDLVQGFELFVPGCWAGDELEHFDHAGDRHVAARRFESAERRGIEVARHYLKDFLAVTRLSLVRHSEFHRRVPVDPAVLGADQRLRVRGRDRNLTWSSSSPPMARSGRATRSGPRSTPRS